jgi:hypothetical protein
MGRDAAARPHDQDGTQFLAASSVLSGSLAETAAVVVDLYQLPERLANPMDCART